MNYEWIDLLFLIACHLCKIATESSVPLVQLAFGWNDTV